MKAIHKNLGEVEVDEACLRLDELDAIGDERHVIYEGDIRKVTASLVQIEASELIGAALFRHGYDTGWTTEEAVACIEAMGERIAELEADGERLRFLITESGMDGFDGHDALDFIEFVASERGHKEPTDDDELDGWRRLLDVARKAQASAGGGE